MSQSQAKPRKGEEGYDPDAEASEPALAVPGGVAMLPAAPPPLHCDLETVLAGAGDLLSLEPPTWVPDSHAGACNACHQPFRCALNPGLPACVSCYVMPRLVSPVGGCVI